MRPTDPVFSEQCVSKPNHDEKDRGTHLKFTRKPLKRGKGTNLATGVNQEDSNQQTVVCSLCKKPHNLNECEQFLTKSRPAHCKTLQRKANVQDVQQAASNITTQP